MGGYETWPSHEQCLTFESVPFSDAEKKELGIENETGEFSNLGLLLSDQCKHAVRVSIYGGDDRDKLVEYRVFTGSLVKQITDIIDFLCHIRQQAPEDAQAGFYEPLTLETGYAQSSYGDGRRIKEALCAALIQRDYSFPGELLVNAFSGRVEFIAMGTLDDGLFLWRNEKLMAALRRLRINANKSVDITATKAAFMIILKNETPPGQKILSYLRENTSISRKEAEALLGLKQTAAGKVLKGLQDNGLVNTVGGGKNIKYILCKR